MNDGVPAFLLHLSLDGTNPGGARPYALVVRPSEGARMATLARGTRREMKDLRTRIIAHLAANADPLRVVAAVLSEVLTRLPDESVRDS